MNNSVYFGGDIITMDMSKENLYAEAVYVKNGVIEKVGTKKEIFEIIENDNRNSVDIKFIDLEGKTLIPAFIDAHSHIAALSNTLLLADLENTQSFSEVKEKFISFLENYSNENSDEWIIGFGYDQNIFKEKKHFNKDLLDEIDSEKPIAAVHKSGHVAVVNSKALEILGIDKNTENPEGGTIGRKENTNEPDGYLEETAFTAVSQYIKRPSFNSLLNSIKNAEKIYLKNGITTVQEGLVDSENIELLKKSSFEVDVVGYVDLNKNPEIIENEKQYVKRYNNNFKLGGYKIFLDGSPQARTAWLSEPYEGEADYKGYGVYTDEQVIGFLLKAIDENLQILAHCNGDMAAEQFINCYEKAFLKSKTKNYVRPVMIHAQLLRCDQMKKVKELGIIPSFFIAHIYFWGETHIKNLGKRASFISPAKSAEKENISFTFHQDSPVLPPDMIETLWCAVNRITSDNTVLGEEEKISVIEALKAVTINAAYQYFEENIKGSISVGKIADFAVLSQNPLKVEKELLRDIKVLKTIKRDKVVYNL